MRPPISNNIVDTYKIMLAGLGLAILMVAPTAALYLNLDWPWVQSLPVYLLNLVLSYMTVFFHELGHTVAGWFYGSVTLPSFDLTHGGGMTYGVTGHLLPLNILIDLTLIYYALSMA